MTGSEIVEKAKKLIGTPYVYGAKYRDGALTLSRLNVLKKENPKTITDSYYNKAKKESQPFSLDVSINRAFFTRLYKTVEIASDTISAMV